jgi:hypothetical protein
MFPSRQMLRSETELVNNNNNNNNNPVAGPVVVQRAVEV